MPRVLSRTISLLAMLLGLSLGLTILPAASHDPNDGKSKFLLQDHGTPRVYRGTDLELNFKPTTTEEEEVATEDELVGIDDAAEAPADAEPDAKPTKRGIQIRRGGQHSRGKIKFQKAKHRAGGSRKKKKMKIHGIGSF